MRTYIKVFDFTSTVNDLIPGTDVVHDFQISKRCYGIPVGLDGSMVIPRRGASIAGAKG